jgi:hypothetical protein
MVRAFSPRRAQAPGPSDDDPDRQAGSDRDRRLDIERAPDDLLSDLPEALRGALAQSWMRAPSLLLALAFEPMLSSVERIAALNGMPQWLSTSSSSPAYPSGSAPDSSACR